MHQSIIYQKQQRPSLTSLSGKVRSPYRSIQQQRPKRTLLFLSSPQRVGQSISNIQLLEYAFNIMQIIIEYQGQIQILKEMLTSRNDFNPEALFTYISRNQQFVDKKDILYFLAELEDKSLDSSRNEQSIKQSYENNIKNSLKSSQSRNIVNSCEEQIKIYLASYGFKQKIDYSAFINSIFPVDVQLLKYITVTGIKKYFHHTQVTGQILCIYVFLLKKELQMIQTIQNFKNDWATNRNIQNISPYKICISRKQIKNLLRIIKKNGQGNSQMQIQSQPYIKFEQLKSLFKNLISSQKNKKGQQTINNPTTNQKKIDYANIQRNLSSIFRKLSMGKNNFINVEDLQFWLKPWSRFRSNQQNGQQANNATMSAIFKMSQISLNGIQDGTQTYGDSGDTDFIEQKQNPIVFPLSHQIGATTTTVV